MVSKIQRSIFRLGLLAAVLALIFGLLPARAGAQSPETLTGWLTILWGDGEDISAEPKQRYLLTSAGGESTPLILDEYLAAASGGILSLNGRQVTVQGDALLKPDGAREFRVTSLSLAEGESKSVTPLAVTGSRPWISILCKFSDIAAEPNDLAYFSGMYADTKPGLNHYWKEVSYNKVNVNGSNAVGWFTLPQPRSAYIINNSLLHDKAAKDCTAAADAQVNFAQFVGINLMFNSDLDGYAWGGGWYGTLDGVSKVWSMTWEPPWGYQNVMVMAHEMGHGFGLPHSSGKYGQTYDNRWDVMSDGWTDCNNSRDAVYGCLAQHTISFHKDYLGWVPANQRFRPFQAAATTITLERLALPQTSNFKMAQIPIGNSLSHFYTVEVRKKNGYDVKLPGQAVIIHEVNLYRSIPAQVIDPDNNGNTGDAGAMWTVGETFTDAANGITISVVSATATGFKVSITSPGPRTNTTQSAAGNDGWILESGESTGKGGTLDSGSLTFALGDNAQDRQYRSILSFNTAGLPDNAVITRVTLKIRKQGLVGSNPFISHGKLMVDIRRGGFGSAAGLQLSDFDAAASKEGAGTFVETPTDGWYRVNLSSASFTFVNRAGITQFRLYFSKDDNDDQSADTMEFFSGNTPTAANRPQLIIKYYLP
jgi:M6 family metalloprotease-like protein